MSIFAINFSTQFNLILTRNIKNKDKKGKERRDICLILEKVSYHVFYEYACMCIKSNNPYLRLSMLISSLTPLLGLAFSSFLRSAISLSFVGFYGCALLNHPLLCIVVVLGILDIAVDTRRHASGGREARRMLGLVVEGGAPCRHHADILRDVLLAGEVAHKVCIGDGVFFFVFLALFDMGKL